MSGASLGLARSSAELLQVIDEPGPVNVQTVASADWKTDLAGLLNLQSAAAKRAGLKDRLEPVGLYFHVLQHPEHGTFVIDTGVEQALRDSPDEAAVSGLSARALHTERLKVRAPLGEWLDQQGLAPTGVLLTHLHVDHLLGLPDLAPGTAIYVGPGELDARSFVNVMVRPTMTRLLAGHAPFRELRFQPDSGGRFRGVLDLFGDRSVWALHVPGHTPGSVAYVARTPEGPVLFTGDTSHTAWGWEHDVTPGTFTADQEDNRKSLSALRRLAAEHPGMQVRLGHQPLRE